MCCEHATKSHASSAGTQQVPGDFLLPPFSCLPFSTVYRVSGCEAMWGGAFLWSVAGLKSMPTYDQTCLPAYWKFWDGLFASPQDVSTFSSPMKTSQFDSIRFEEYILSLLIYCLRDKIIIRASLELAWWSVFSRMSLLADVQTLGVSQPLRRISLRPFCDAQQERPETQFHSLYFYKSK